MIKLGYFKRIQPCRPPQTERVDYFRKNATTNKLTNLSTVPLKAFGWITINTVNIPNWFKAVNSEQVITNNDIHWSELNEFNLTIGDIKTVWELSRFDWLMVFSCNYRATGDPIWLNKANDWLNDWQLNNPANTGVNWRCGQEASIRVIHLIAAQFILSSDSASTGLLNLVEQHLQRISPTRFYAMAQDNNHGTSEACALFVGASLLLSQPKYLTHQQLTRAKRWQKQGRFWLENRVKKLISNDGSFSQYSTNYHRLMLDTLCFAEQARRQFNLTKFSAKFYRNAQQAASWLGQLTDKSTGDVANIGANDGARLFPITNCDYRDYRPSVQWAFGLFHNAFLYDKSGEYQQLSMLLSPQNQDLKQSTAIAAYQKHRLTEEVLQLTSQQVRVNLRTPQAKFRPSSCDALHLDLWLGSVNLLRDAGSYSYNCLPEKQHYFPSTGAHNTAQFDHQEQMPKISRFLYGQWIKALILKHNDSQLICRYRDYQHNQHQRIVTLADTQLIVEDTLAGFNSNVVLTWRLIPANWLLSGNYLRSDLATIQVQSSQGDCKIELINESESRYYLHESAIPVLTITSQDACQITTKINWAT
ncbi:heparinase II/III domain-containing protein [Colwellia sp. MEBiC06753]